MLKGKFSLIKIMQIFTLKKFNEFFTKGHERSLKAKKNIAASFVLKGGSILCNLALVPLTLNYLDSTKYGIWITLSSIIAWFSFFDIGLGNGLKNRFAEAVANQDFKLASKYVSTTYVLLIFISTILFILFFTINPILNWCSILNAPQGLNNELRELALIVFGFFCLQFVLQIINIILIADQTPALNGLNNFITSLISLIAIYLLTLITKGSLIYLGLIVSVVPLIVLTSASLFFFRKRYKDYKPSLSNVDLGRIKDLTSLGIKFFIIQISAIILFTTDNIIIAQLLGLRK